MNINPDQLMPNVIQQLSITPRTMEQNLLKSRVALTALLVVAVLVLAATFEWEWAMNLSAFAFGIGKVSLGIMLVKLIDDWVYNGIDTIMELRNGNSAVALHQLGLFALVALVLLST